VTWTQPVCLDRFYMLYPEWHGKRIAHAMNLPPEEWEPCCFCRRPTNIYVRLDPATVPYPREEKA